MGGLVQAVSNAGAAHTCKSGTHEKRGADLKFHMDHVSWTGYSDHDWRDCPGCKRDYANRRSRQMVQHIKRDGDLVVSNYETVDDFQRRRKCWNQQASRGGDRVIFTPFYQDDGRVIVVHTGDQEKTGGDIIGVDDFQRLNDMVYTWCENPAVDKRNRASNGWGLDYAGTRGDNRKDSGDVYQINVEGASPTRIGRRAFGIELNSFGYARFDGDPADNYLLMLDWLHQERLEGHYYQIAEPLPQSNDNEVMQAIFNDPRVQEAIKAYKLWETEKEPEPVEVERQEGKRKPIPQQTRLDFTPKKEPADIVLTYSGTGPAPSVEGVQYV